MAIHGLAQRFGGLPWQNSPSGNVPTIRAEIPGVTPKKQWADPMVTNHVEAKEPTPMGQPDSDNDADDKGFNGREPMSDPWFPPNDPRNGNEGIVPDSQGAPVPTDEKVGMGSALADLIRQWFNQSEKYQSPPYINPTMVNGQPPPPNTRPAIVENSPNAGTKPGFVDGQFVLPKPRPPVMTSLPHGLKINPSAFSRTM